MVTKVIQSGLSTFANTLEGYLTGIGVNRHFNKFSEDLLGSHELYEQIL